MTPDLGPDARLSRRDFLRGAAIGGGALFGASILGCGDDDGGTPSATLEPTPFATVGGQATQSAPGMQWTRISPAGAQPPPRYDHTLVTDGAKLYLFGGRSPEPFADLWSYDVAAAAWTQLAPARGPIARFGHNAAWDAPHSRMIVFGGQNGDDFYNDISEFDPASGAWNDPLAGADPVSLPAPRYGAAACLDDAGHLLVTHGFTATGRFDDTWQYDLASPGWTNITPNDTLPVKRCLIDAVWDMRKQRLLIYGGQSNEAPYMDDLWGFSPEFSGWQRIERLPRPSPRNMYALVYDTTRSAATLIGGRTEDGQASDAWVFNADGETWTEADPQGGPLPARYGHDACIARDGSIYLFGGTDGSTTYNDLWRLEITG
jgi:hypothetical protein